MSVHNHDPQDPNWVRSRYVKKDEKDDSDKDRSKEGEAIKIYLEANTKSLRDFIKWFKERGQ